jgi:hypothetical protein
MKLDARTGVKAFDNALLFPSEYLLRVPPRPSKQKRLIPRCGI